MRLMTYNFLTSKAKKGVKEGYPLELKITKHISSEVEFNPIFMKKLLPRLNWSVIKLAAAACDLAEDIPEELPERLDEAEGLLQSLHHLLIEVEVLEGELQCPETGRLYLIRDGIPNMLLNEDEV